MNLGLISLGFTAGVLLVHALPSLPPLSWLLAALLLSLYPWRYRAPLAMLVLGAALTVFYAQRLLDQRWPESRHQEERWVSGHVISLPEWEVRDGLRTVRFLFSPDADELPARIRASWYAEPAPLRAGECWSFRLRLKTPHGSLNPGSFDYEGWLFRQGIAATATVKEAEPCAAEKFDPILRLRQRIGDAIQGWLPGHPAQPLVTALVTGDDAGLSDAEWETFRRTGTSHLVAISGFNIALIAGVAFFLGRWGWSLCPPLCRVLPAQRTGVLLSAGLSLVYALLAGFEPPVLRALLMLWTVLAAAWLHRLSQASHVLALAWLIILLADPLAITSPGLWLSFGAVAAMFYFSLNRYGQRPAWQIFLLMQALLSVVLMPVTLFFFQGVSWSAPWLNLLAIPVMSLLTPVLLLAVGLSALWPLAGVPLLRLCADALALGQTGLTTVAAWPGLWWSASPPWPVLALALFGAFLLFVPRGVPLRPLALLCGIPLLFPVTQRPASGVDVTVLDVGQGLAVVLNTAKHTLVFDAGPAYEEGFDAGESIVVPYLLSRGIRTVDQLMISHADTDHSGGAGAVRKQLKVIETLGFDGRPCRDGEHWEWEGVRFTLLHPDDGSWSRNDSSCVLKVEAGGHALLLPGDIGKRAEKRLLEQHPETVRAEVLLAPHHGSKTSSTAAFIAAVQPRLVIHSAGWRHHFGHPHPPVVRRYRDAGASQQVTGGLGALRFHIGADGVSAVRSYRQEAGRWWNAPTDTLGMMESN